MRYALIGCGRISPNHIEAAKNNHLEIAAVCDLAEEKMRGRFDLPDSVHFYTDYKTLLTNEKPELVSSRRKAASMPRLLWTVLRRGVT